MCLLLIPVVVEGDAAGASVEVEAAMAAKVEAVAEVEVKAEPPILMIQVNPTSYLPTLHGRPSHKTSRTKCASKGLIIGSVKPQQPNLNLEKGSMCPLKTPNPKQHNPKLIWA